MNKCHRPSAGSLLGNIHLFQLSNELKRLSSLGPLKTSGGCSSPQASLCPTANNQWGINIHKLRDTGIIFPIQLKARGSIMFSWRDPKTKLFHGLGLHFRTWKGAVWHLPYLLHRVMWGQNEKLANRVGLVSADHSSNPNPVLDLPGDLEQEKLLESPLLHLHKVNLKMWICIMFIILAINIGHCDSLGHCQENAMY